MDTKLHQFQSSVMDISQQTNGNPKCFNYCFLFETNELPNASSNIGNQFSIL
jgi:hypothetical protein